MGACTSVRLRCFGSIGTTLPCHRNNLSPIAARLPFVNRGASPCREAPPRERRGQCRFGGRRARCRMAVVRSRFGLSEDSTAVDEAGVESGCVMEHQRAARRSCSRKSGRNTPSTRIE
jgi:hypothetical protein